MTSLEKAESLFAARKLALQAEERSRALAIEADREYLAALNALRAEFAAVPDGYGKESAAQNAHDTAFVDKAFDSENEAAWFVIALSTYEIFTNSAEGALA